MASKDAGQQNRDLKPLHRIVGYIYPTESDLNHCNHKYMFDWCMRLEDIIGVVSDKNLIYSTQNLRIGWNPTYDTVRNSIDENTIEDYDAWIIAASSLDSIDALWRKTGDTLSRFLAMEIGQDELYTSLKPHFEEITVILNATLDTGFCKSKPYLELMDAVVGLAGTLGDLQLLIKPNERRVRSDSNLRECIRDLKSRYASDYVRVRRLLKDLDPL